MQKIGLIIFFNFIIGCGLLKNDKTLDSTKSINWDSKEKFPGFIRMDLNSQNNEILSASISGNFYSSSSSNKLVKVGNIAVNGFNLISDENNLYRSYNPTTNTHAIDMKTLHSFAGKEISFSVDGNKEFGYGQFTEKVRIPEPIIVTNIPKDGIDVKSGCEFNWSKSTVNDPVVIELRWIKVNSEMDSTKRKNMVITIQDEGAFRLTPEILSQFDASGKIGVNIKRYVTHEVSGIKNVGIVCVNSNTVGYFKFK